MPEQPKNQNRIPEDQGSNPERELSPQQPEGNKQKPSPREQLRGFSKKSEQEQIETIRSLKDFGKEGLNTASELLNNFEHDLAGKRSALVGQFENILKLQALRAELQAPPSAKLMMEEYIKAQKLLSEIGRQLDFDQEVAGRVVATARTALEETFRGDPELWAEYEQQVKATDLASVGEAHNAVFIHNFVGGSREHLAGIKGTGVQTKEDMRTRFELIAGLEPTLSCSTLQRGDTSENIFGSYSKVGVILKGGTIEDADYGDAGSTQVDAKTRVSQSRMDRSAPLSQKVVDAIAKRGNGYNELIVRDPEIAGIFINYDRVEESQTATRLSPEKLSSQEQQIEEALGLAAEYSLPIYWMEAGKMKRYDAYDPATKTFKPHREEVIADAPDYLGLPYNDIKDSPFSPSVEQRKQMSKNTIERNILQNVPEELRREVE